MSSSRKGPAVEDDDLKSVVAWVEDEFESISSDAADNTQTYQVAISYAAPNRPRTGMLAYADGTKWNPGSGAGMYYFGDDNVWHLMRGSAVTSGVTNGKLVESHTGGAATFALKTLAGADPSPSDPVFLACQDGSVLTIISATSVTLSSGSTLQMTNGVAARLWFVLINDAGVARLGVRRCSDPNGIYGFPSSGVISTTAEGGAGGADSVGVTYSTVAVTSMPFVIFGYRTYESGLAVAGTWDVSPDPFVPFGPGIPRPGDPMGNSGQARSTTTLSNTTAAYVDTALTKSIVVASAANLVATVFSGGGQIDTIARLGYVALRRGGAIIGEPQRFGYGAANMIGPVGGSWVDFPGAAGTAVYVISTSLDAGAPGATYYFMNTAAGGVLILEELMG